MIHPPLEGFLCVKHAAQGVAGDFFAGLGIGQRFASLLVLLDVLLSQFIYTFKSHLLRLVFQKLSLQLTTASFVPRIIPVVRLMQNGSEGVRPCLSAEEHLTQGCIHIPTSIILQLLADRYRRVAGCRKQINQSPVFIGDQGVVGIFSRTGPGCICQSGLSVSAFLQSLNQPLVEYLLQRLGAAGCG